MAEISFELFNNILVQQLVGPQDDNLRLIEKMTGTEISSFGNQINIKGNQDAINLAKNAIDALYNKVSRGIEIGEEEVKAAVEQGFQPISLGRSRLRTETAALVACHILNLYNQ